jgi:hypothetical protein
MTAPAPLFVRSGDAFREAPDSIVARFTDDAPMLRNGEALRDFLLTQLAPETARCSL